jgi:hypothetical protein
MPHNFFLSHYSEDKDVAEIISVVLARISLRQVISWYSSDTAETGGLKPGTIWFNEIIDRIRQSKALIAILTPNSVNRPWVYFESGIAEALSTCELIPVSIGLKKDDIPSPLYHYKCYQLTDYKSLRDFVSKLLTKFDVNFDEEMCKRILEQCILKLSKLKFDANRSLKEKVPKTDEWLQDLKNHIDKRFIDLFDRQFKLNTGEAVSIIDQHFDVAESIIFTATFNIQFPKFERELYLPIRSDDSVQDVLNQLYFLLGDHIQPFTYMEKWILKNISTGQRLVLREIGNLVPARYIFKPDIEWTAIKIDHEYTATSSNEFMTGIKHPYDYQTED